MTTLVFRAPSGGALQQLQVGAADLVATVSAAFSVWGWIDGLTGINSILQLCQDQQERKQLERLFQLVQHDLPQCRILTSAGLESIYLDSKKPTFGPTLSSKVVGYTFCALAHNMQVDAAGRVFMHCFASILFGKGLSKIAGSKEALHTLLTERRQTILHEGSTCGLPGKFKRAIDALGLPPLRKGSSHPNLFSRFNDPDAALVDGFLAWLSKEMKETYYTRSAAVARLAVCLKEIGYTISGIQVWDGEGERPAPPRSLVIVVGGSSETDVLLEHDNQFIFRMPQITHYRSNTVGAMLWNAFRQDCLHPVETFQQDFDQINQEIAYDLDFGWAYINILSGQVQAVPIWRAGRPVPSRYAIRLATYFFPESVDEISIYYQKIAKLKYVEAAKIGAEAGVISENDRELQRLQTFTASICIAILSRIAGPEFKTIHHSTTLDLSGNLDLKWLCQQVDAILSHKCPQSRIATAIAVLHCGVRFPHNSFHEEFFANPDHGSIEESIVIGWRNCDYAVLPRLLFSMSKSMNKANMLGFHCTDAFIGNIPSHRDGSITSPKDLPDGRIQESNEQLLDAMCSTDIEAQANHVRGADARQPIIFGSPIPQEPDMQLYLSIERPPSSAQDPHVSLCGRINGEAIGFVGVPQILVTLANSWNIAKRNVEWPCPQHDPHEDVLQKSSQQTAALVFNVPASIYTEPDVAKPRCNSNQDPRYHTYVPVLNNTPWALFVAGDDYIRSRVVFGCVECAAHSGGNCVSDMSGGLMTLIGYS
jgi:hypothetical protein